MYWLTTSRRRFLQASGLATEGSGNRQVSGRLAMWMSHTIHTVLLLENQDKLNWQVVPNPMAFEGGPSTTMLWTSGFGIVDGTDHRGTPAGPS